MGNKKGIRIRRINNKIIIIIIDSKLGAPHNKCCHWKIILYITIYRVSIQKASGSAFTQILMTVIDEKFHRLAPKLEWSSVDYPSRRSLPLKTVTTPRGRRLEFCDVVYLLLLSSLSLLFYYTLCCGCVCV